MLGCSIGLHDVLYRLVLLGQCVFYAAALAGWRAPSPESRAASPESRAPSYFRILSVPYAICLVNLATVVAFVRFVTGTQRVTWERATPLPSPALPRMLRSSRS